MMKKMIFLGLLISTSIFANIPTGSYRLEKIVCTNGKALKLGGKFMQYNIVLDITEDIMRMTAVAKNGSWAPFKLRCTQINEGKFSYTKDNHYEGYLDLLSVSCNAAAWESILRKQLFGVESQGSFEYHVKGNKLTIQNPNTITKYSCKKSNSIPVYHYIKM